MPKARSVTFFSVRMASASRRFWMLSLCSAHTIVGREGLVVAEFTFAVLDSRLNSDGLGNRFARGLVMTMEMKAFRNHEWFRDS